MLGNPAIRFTVWHRGGAVEASLHLQVRLYVRQAAIGRVVDLSPILHGYLDLSRAHAGRRSRWIVDLGIGDAARPAMIRAAVGVTVRHLAAIIGTTFAIVATGEASEALNDTPLRLFAIVVEARRWLATTLH